MNFRKKTSNVTKVLYVILAMCVLSIIGLTLYSLFSQPGGPNDNLSMLYNPPNNDQDVFADRPPPTTNPPPTMPPPAPTQRPPTPTRPAPPPPPPPTMPPVTTPPPEVTPAPPPQTPAANETAASPPATDTPPQTPPAPPPNPRPTPPPAAFSPDDDALEESIEVMAVDNVDVSELEAPSSFVRPLNGHISQFHRPYTAEFSLAMNDFRTHIGINIDNVIGANVHAVADGVIAEIRDDPFRGQTVIIEHGGGFVSTYQNLQPMLPSNITVGASVTAGDVIGGVGDTALIRMTEVPHLHFEMTLHGEYVDPLDYIAF